MIRSTSPRSSLALVALALVACDDPNAPDDGDDGPDPLPAVSAATVLEGGPIFRSLEVTLDDSAGVEVFYAPVAGGAVFRMRADSVALHHEILLPRLREATGYRFAVRAFDATRTADSIARGTFETDSLPVELTQFDYSVSGTSTFPLLMVPFRSTTSGWAGQVAIESDGAIVWYVESVGGTLVAAPVPGTHDMVFIENGFPSDSGRNGIARVSPEGEVVALLERDSDVSGQIHHDMTAVDDERALFIAYDTMTVRDTVVYGEAVWEWNMHTGAVEKKWSSWDFFDWEDDRGASNNPRSWLHANSISIGPRGNTVISSRSLNQVFSIAPDFQSLEWRVGGVNATHRLSAADQFIGQHSAWELPGNRILLFDNAGAGDLDDHSRALEVEFGQDSAWAVWQYDADPPINAPLRGGVYRLASGNTVTIFPSSPFTVHETTPGGEVVWTMTGDMQFTNTFRVTPWPSIAGEAEVDAMP